MQERDWEKEFPDSSPGEREYKCTRCEETFKRLSKYIKHTLITCDNKYERDENGKLKLSKPEE